MSNLKNDVDNLIQKQSKPSICSVAKVINVIKRDHGDELATSVEAIMNDANYAASNVALTLRKNGYPISRDSIYKHRRNGQPDGCICKL